MPEAHQVFAHRVGAPLAEREVVFVGAARVGVPFDRDAHRRPPAQEVRVLLQHGAIVVGQRELVVVEQHVAERPLGVQLVERLAREDLFLGQRRGRRGRRRRGRRRGRRRRRRRGTATAAGGGAGGGGAGGGTFLLHPDSPITITSTSASEGTHRRSFISGLSCVFLRLRSRDELSVRSITCQSRRDRIARVRRTGEVRAAARRTCPPPRPGR